MMTVYPPTIYPPTAPTTDSGSTLSGSYTAINSAFNDVLNQNRDSQVAMANMAATQSELLRQLADMREKYEAIIAAQNQHNHRSDAIATATDQTRATRTHKDIAGPMGTMCAKDTIAPPVATKHQGTKLPRHEKTTWEAPNWVNHTPDSGGEHSK